MEPKCEVCQDTDRGSSVPVLVQVKELPLVCPNTLHRHRLTNHGAKGEQQEMAPPLPCPCCPII